MITLFSKVPVFAIQDGSNPPNQRNEEFRQYIIFVALERDCKMYDKEILEFFKLIASTYLQKYGFTLIGTSSECINAKGKVVYDPASKNYGLRGLDEAVNRAEKWGSKLVIIVFDEKAGKQYKLETLKKVNQVYEGHIFYGSYDHIVSTSSFGKDGESALNASILSHELSHFILRYLGYPESVFRDWVHLTQKRYDQCSENNFSFSDCHNTFTTIKGRTGTYFHVLAPYDKPISTSEQKNQPKQSNENKPKQENTQSSKFKTETKLFINKNIVFGKFVDGKSICFDVTVRIPETNAKVTNARVRVTIDPEGKVYGDWIIPRWNLPLNQNGEASICMVWDGRNSKVNAWADYLGDDKTFPSKSQSVWLEVKPKNKIQPFLELEINNKKGIISLQDGDIVCTKVSSDGTLKNKQIRMAYNYPDTPKFTNTANYWLDSSGVYEQCNTWNMGNERIDLYVEFLGDAYYERVASIIVFINYK